MKASLIFSSTSHSINVQKVRGYCFNRRPCANISSDLQDRAIKGLWPQVHYSRDRKHRRTLTPLPSRL